MRDWESARRLAKSKRAAQSILRGPEIFAFVTRSKPLLLRTAKKNPQVPPIAAIGPLLYAEFAECVQSVQVKQWIGALARALLATEHYKINRSGVRIVGDPLFATGSTYRYVGRGSESPENLEIERTLRVFVRNLTVVERRILCRVIEEEFS